MSTSDAPPRTVGGRYRLERSIGSGGMGTVWRGTDELLGRKVAIKEVRFPAEVGEAEQRELRERTLREARATARLSHPSVVTTYDVVEDDGRPFIVMELLEARSLSEVLRQDGPLPPHRVAEIGLEMLSALEMSHRQGIVHRDVKPGNVLLTPDGRAVLTDFGIATMAGDPALTSTGVVLGSPAYMAPERARGRKPGPEADLWSLGATLYAAVEGRPPFETDNALSTLTAVISDPVPPPTAASGPLREAILGMLTKDPEQRLDIDGARPLLQAAAADRSTSATAVPPAAAALDRAGRTEALPPVVPTRVGDRAAPDAERMTTYAPRSRGPNRALLAALLVALLLIAGIASIALLNDDPDEPNRTAEPAQSPTTAQQSTPENTPAQPTQEETPQGQETGGGNPGVPEGFQLYSDPSGFSVAVPQGWTAVPGPGSAVDIEDPNGDQFLRIDQTRQPKDDPAADWERQERSVSKRLPNYQRIRIEPVDYRGWEAADWEFTFGSGTHVLNRGFVPNENHGYALYMSGPEGQWNEALGVFQVAADTFQPAP